MAFLTGVIVLSMAGSLGLFKIVHQTFGKSSKLDDVPFEGRSAFVGLSRRLFGPDTFELPRSFTSLDTPAPAPASTATGSRQDLTNGRQGFVNKGQPKPRSIIFWPLPGVTAAVPQNIMHRVGLSQGMRVALPNNAYNLTYDPEARSEWEIDDPRPMLICSGYLQRLGAPATVKNTVPDSFLVTILGNPEVMKTTTLQLPLLMGGSPLRFIQWSQAKGLGLDNYANAADAVKAAAAAFDVVLLADHMELSLAMLRRRMGWRLEDVVYCRQIGFLEAPDARTPRWGPPGKAWYHPGGADRALYDHFLGVLNDAAQNDQSLKADADQLRVLVESASASCSGRGRYGQDPILDQLIAQQRMSHPASQKEETGHQGDEFAVAPSSEQLLAEATTFVRLFRLNLGLGPRSRRMAGGPRDHSSEVAKPLVWIKTHKTGSSTMTNVFHRIVTRQGQSVAVPLDNLFIGWPKVPRMLSGVALTEGTPFHFEAFGSGHSRYDRPTMEAIVPGAT